VVNRMMLVIACTGIFLIGAMPGSAQLDWSHLTIDPTTTTPGVDVGRGVTLVLNPRTGRPMVSYTTSPGDEIRRAEYVGSGGTCGPNQSWECESPDTVQAGPETDVAVYSATLTWALGIVYRDVTANQIVYWERRWVSLPLPGHWTTSREVVYEGSLFRAAGRHLSLAFDSNGFPHIAAWCSSAIVPDLLMHATRIGSGGSCGIGAAAGAWECTTIESGTDVGQHPAIAIAVALGDVVEISSFDGGNGRLRLAEYVGFGTGTCLSGASGWYCQTIDDDVPVCRATALEIGGDADAPEVRIAYHVGSLTTSWGEVRIAKPDLSSGNCGSGQWWCFALEDTGTDTEIGLALGHDSLDRMVVAYRRPLYGDVRLAREAHNIVVLDPCGPVGSPLPFQGWQCQTFVHSASSVTPGDWLDLAVTDADDPIVVYHTLNTATGAGEVRITHRWLFQDGFETRNTSSWSVTSGSP